ncbi:MAG: 7TM-DISM domain-containing protein [Wenzhouxiangella sp.]|nr:7TM-DISM domain-containing protein [Wenzhouxiangella sp.]
MSIGWGASTEASAQAIIEQAWFEDPAAQMTIADARQSDKWTPYAGLLSEGYGTGAVWVRLVIEPSSVEPLILALQPVYLDQVEIFGAASNEPLAVVGDWVHPKSAERIAQAFSYTLPVTDEPTELWLRLTSTSTRQLLVQVLTENEWVTDQLQNQLGSVFYVVALFVLFITALVQWRLSQDRIFAVFALSVGTACAYGLSVTGLLRLVWPMDWPAMGLDAYQSFFSVSATVAGIAFHLAFIRRLGLPAWGLMISRVYLAYQLVKFVLLASDQVILALTLNLWDVLIAPFLFLGLVLLSGRGMDADRSLPRWMVVGLYSVLLGFLLLAALPGLGLLAAPEFSLYVVQVNALMTTVLILGLLQYRQRRLNAQQLELETKADLAEQAAEKERFARTEQQRLLDMLTHELKTPLAVMRLKLEDSHAATPAISKAIGDMSDMIERCTQANQAEDGRLTVNQASTDLTTLIGDVVSSATKSHREVRVDLTDHHACTTITTDPQLTTVILMNLIENACKYSPPASAINVDLQPAKDGGWCVAIGNLPGEAGWPDPTQVFEKYYRSSHAQRQPGTGLGLFLAQALTEMLQGQLDYAPTQTHVRFVLWLPKHPWA